MRQTTRILYPRFQTEPWPRHRAEWIVPAGDHLSEQDYDAAKRLIDAKGGRAHPANDAWWGVSHDVKQVTTEPHDKEIAGLPDYMKTFRVKMIGHFSLWDHQSGGQQAHELVLGYDLDNEFNELAAVLNIRGSGFGRGDQQRFTANHLGLYEAPSSGEDVYLRIMSEIVKEEAGVTRA